MPYDENDLRNAQSLGELKATAASQGQVLQTIQAMLGTLDAKLGTHAAKFEEAMTKIGQRSDALAASFERHLADSHAYWARTDKAIDELRTETSKDIAELRRDLSNVRHDVQGRVPKTFFVSIWQVGAALIAAGGAIIGIIYELHRLGWLGF